MMNSNHEFEFVSLSNFFSAPKNEYSFDAVRKRLLVAIGLAEVEGYSATHEALIELLRELEASSVLTSVEKQHIGCA